MATETRRSTTLTEWKARAVLPLRQNWCIRSATVVGHADVCESVLTDRSSCLNVCEDSATELKDRKIATSADVADRCADRYLVDPASGHMLVSKIKPCMS